MSNLLLFILFGALEKYSNSVIGILEGPLFTRPEECPFNANGCGWCWLLPSCCIMSWMERSCCPFLSQVRNATAGNSTEITLTKRLRIPQILCRPGWKTGQNGSRKPPRRSGWIGKDQSSPVWISFIVTPTQSPLSIPRTERGRKVHKTRNNKHANYSHLLISIRLPMEGWSQRKNEPLGNRRS